jgi:hypothetical protein
MPLPAEIMLYNAAFRAPYTNADLVGQQNWIAATSASFPDHINVASNKLEFVNNGASTGRGAQQVVGIAALDFSQPFAVDMTCDFVRNDDTGCGAEFLLGHKDPAGTNRLTVEFRRGLNDILNNLAEIHYRLPGGNVVTTAPFACSAGSHTIRAEVNGTAVKLMIDGANVQALTAPAAASTIASKTLEIYLTGDEQGSLGGDTVHVTSIKVYQPFVTRVGLSVVTKTIGAAGDYATLALAAAANYTAYDVVDWVLLGETHDAAGTTVDVGLFFKNGSTLNVYGDYPPSGVFSQTGMSTIKNQIIFSDVTDNSQGAAAVTFCNIRLGDSTTRGRMTMTLGTAAGTGASLLLNGIVRNILGYDNQAQSTGTMVLVSLNGSQGASVFAENVECIALINPTGGIKSGIAVSSSVVGSSFNASIYHCSVRSDNFTRPISINYVGILNLDDRNCMPVGTTTSKLGWVSVTTTGTLNRNASSSGNRSSDASAPGSSAITGLITTDVWRDITTSFAVIPNANTLLSAVTTPTIADFSGYARPQSGGQIYAGSLVARPLAPTALAATGGNTTVALSWTASNDAATNKVYKDGSLSTSGIVGTTNTQTGLTNGVSKSFAVAAVDGSGNEGPKSAATSATPHAAVAAANPPIALFLD